MKTDFLHAKIYTVFLSIFYVFGLLGAFLKHEAFYAVISLVVLILFVIFYNLDFKKAIFLYLIFFLGLFMGLKASCFDSFMDEINSNNAVVRGRIVSSKNIIKKKDTIKFYLMADEIDVYNKEFKNLNTKILVNINNINEFQDKINLGDVISIKGKIRTPNNATNPYQFDYKNYLLNNDCKFILYADNSMFKTIKEPEFSKDLNEDWYYILRQFENTRNKILKVHSKNIKSPKLEILGGIVFGNETINPDDNIKESFKNSGLLHLLAASGLNVALIYGIWWWIANLIKFPYNLSIFLGAVFVILYTFMTGFPPSILRASLMLLFVLFGKIIDREADSIALIFFVGLLILLFNPKMIFDVGFQLSFMVTFGLIVSCPVLISKFDKIDNDFKEKYKKLSRFKKYFLFLFSPKALISIISVPLFAQIWVIPLQMHYFNNFAPFSLLANIAVVPFIGILSFIGFISSIVALIPFLSNYMVYLFDLIANPLLGLLIKISTIFSSFKISLLNTTGLNVFQIFNYWIIVLLVVLNLKNNFKNKKHILYLTIFVLIFFISFIKLDYFKHNLEIIMFDVGNADSFLIKTPKNKFIMIDTGKKTYLGNNSADNIINRYFKNERINSLEALIITHFDSDHSGGSVSILKEEKVKTTYLQNNNPKTATAKEIIDYINTNKINYRIINGFEKIYSEPDLNIFVIKPDINGNVSDNDNSLITLLNYKNKKFLFMADSSIKGYRAIEKYINGEVEILKVAHHGAYNVVDKNMLNKIKPKYALISTGINKFNHPNPKTVNLLYENNVKVISSKDYGFVKSIIKDKSADFYHYNSNDKKLHKVKFDKIIEVPFSESSYAKNLAKSLL